MTHLSIWYRNTIQRDTELELTIQEIHQWDKSLKEEIHFLKRKAF